MDYVSGVGDREVNTGWEEIWGVVVRTTSWGGEDDRQSVEDGRVVDNEGLQNREADWEPGRVIRGTGNS